MKNFYTLEGTEGSGKSTAAKLVVDLLLKKGYKVIYTREPGGTSISTCEKIRDLILSEDMASIDPITEYLLYLASRKEHIEKLIKPKLKQGYIVISDRYNDSSLVYQGYTKANKPLMLEQISSLVIKDFFPQKTFLIDLNPKIGLERIQKYRQDQINRFDKLDLSFHQKVRQSYLNLAKKYPVRFKIISGELKAQVIAEKIFLQILKDIDGK